MSIYAYECNDINCECHKNETMHCPNCGWLYYWNIKEPSHVCSECE
jgi:hypothetical protein